MQKPDSGARLTFLIFPLLAALAGSGCAHAQKQDRASLMRSTAERFHQLVRWNDFQGAAGLLTPERQPGFLEARERLEDEKNLTVSDYELLELVLGEDGEQGEVLSKMSWFRLPSDKQETATIRTILVHQNGRWLVSKQNKGPFTPELSREYPVAPAAAETPAAP